MKATTANAIAVTTGGRWIRAIVAAGLLSTVAYAWSQEAAKPPAEPPPQPSAEQKAETPPQPAQETSAPPATSPEQTENKQEAEGAEAPERFIPSQKSSADNSATFPIDI